MSSLVPVLSEWSRMLDGIVEKPRINDLVYRSGTTTNKMDISENDDAYLVTVDVPGMTKEDVNVTVEDGLLTISGECTRKHLDKDSDYKDIRIERSYSRFERSFTLPEDVANAGNISAKVENGLLCVKLPKSEKSKPKKIRVE